jgi:hypothetical protein
MRIRTRTAGRRPLARRLDIARYPADLRTKLAQVRFHGLLTRAIAALPVIDDDSFGAALQFAAGGSGLLLPEFRYPRLDELVARTAVDTGAMTPELLSAPAPPAN